MHWHCWNGDSRRKKPQQSCFSIIRKACSVNSAAASAAHPWSTSADNPCRLIPGTVFVGHGSCRIRLLFCRIRLLRQACRSRRRSEKLFSDERRHTNVFAACRWSTRQKFASALQRSFFAVRAAQSRPYPASGCRLCARGRQFVTFRSLPEVNSNSYSGCRGRVLVNGSAIGCAAKD